MIDTTASFLLLPPANSTVASEIDSIFYFILYTSAIIFALVVGVMIFFAIRYRRRKEGELTTGVAHNTAMEITWTVIPTILVLIVFVWGFKSYMRLNVVPANAIEIKTTGQKWFWTFDYPEGANSVNELIIPVNQPIKLLLSSQDVIHSFFIPNFRIKMDVLPNRYTVVWFEATDTGVYDLYCTEFCGKGHSEMLGKVKVVEPEEYVTWLDKATVLGEGLTLAEYGEQLYTTKACNTCHSIDGSRIQGPSFKGVFGKKEEMKDGSIVTIDENYLRESILVPRAKVVKGYEPVMPTFQGILKDKQVDALIAFIKSLQE